MDGDNVNVWKDIDLRKDWEPFPTSYKISSMNKKARSKNPLKPKEPIKWVFTDIITATAPKRLTSEATFFNYILIVDAYSKIPKFYGIVKITT